MTENVEEQAPLLWLFIPLLLAIFVVITPYQKGQQFAQDRITFFMEQGCESPTPGYGNCFSLLDASQVDRPVITRGLLVTANDKRVAIFNENGLELWPMLDNYQLYRPHAFPVDTDGE